MHAEHLFPVKYIYGLNRTFNFFAFKMWVHCLRVPCLCLFLSIRQLVETEGSWKGKQVYKSYFLAQNSFLNLLSKSRSHSHLLFVIPSPSDPNFIFPVEKNNKKKAVTSYPWRPIKQAPFNG